MLEKYYERPQTVDRVRGSWIGPQIEQYVTWLAGHGYDERCVLRRVPLLAAFGEFAAAGGARQLTDLPGHVSAFTDMRVRQSRDHPLSRGSTLDKDVRGPVEQMLTVVLEGYQGSERPLRPDPFAEVLPGFFGYLESERGLRPATVKSYRHYLRRFEAWLDRTGVRRLEDLSPQLLSAYAADRAALGLARTTVREGCGVLRVFLRYACREGIMSRDLSEAVEWPQAYRLATLPRSISWEDVGRVLAIPDRRTPLGRRDYAILLLLATYGLRAREIVALTLDDIDWKRGRLAIPERKGAHSTAFPLSGSAGDALADYLRNGRPDTGDRHVFFRVLAPIRPVTGVLVTNVARRCLLQAGIEVPRPGSHTLRHSAVQRLSDEGFSLKTIGDYVGHRQPASTDIYAKVAVESLREVALGDGEEALR